MCIIKIIRKTTIEQNGNQQLQEQQTNIGMGQEQILKKGIRYDSSQQKSNKIRPDSAKVIMPGLPNFSEIDTIRDHQDSYTQYISTNRQYQPISRPYSAISIRFQQNISIAQEQVKQRLSCFYQQQTSKLMVCIDLRQFYSSLIGKVIYQIKQKSSSTNPVLNDISRKIPKYIKKDKEQLYSDAVMLRMKQNDLQEENLKLKTQIQQQEKEIDKLQGLVQNVDSFINMRHYYSSQKGLGLQQEKQIQLNETILMISLKKQVKDLKAKVEQREQELNKLKQDQKFTKIEELRIENKASQEEGMRLRTLLDQALRNQALLQMGLRTHDFNQLEEKFYIQMQIINGLKQENDQIHGLLRFQEEENFRLQNLLDDSMKNLNKCELIIKDFRKNNKEKSSEIGTLVERIEEYKDVNAGLYDKATLLDMSRVKIKNLEVYQQELLKKISLKEKDVEYLDKTINELKQKLADKSIFEAKEKHILQDELTKMQTMYDELDDKYKNLLLIQHQIKHKETMPSSVAKEARQQTIQLNYQQQRNRKVADTSQQDNQFMNKLEYNPKKLRVVKNSDMKAIGIELNMRFRLKRMSQLDVIEQYLFDDENKKSGLVSIKELNLRFMREPFLLVNHDKSMLLARYLIEDNSQEFADFNVDQTESLLIVRSIFTKLIGNYKIFTTDEDTKIKEEIIPVCGQIHLTYFRQQ